MKPESAAPVQDFESVSDEEIAARVCTGETALFEVIMRRYNRRLYRTVRAILRDDQETEDVMQEAYVQAYRHLHQFRGQAALSTWLTRIAINQALGRLRKRGPDSNTDETGTDMTDYADHRAPNPEKQAYNTELGAAVESALKELPLRYRSVLMLRDVEGLSTAETADCLGISVEAAKVSLHRARLRLKETLEKRCGSTLNELFAFPATRCDRVVERVLRQIRAIS